MADIPLYQAVNIGAVVLLPAAMLTAALILRNDKSSPPSPHGFPSSFDTWAAAFIVLAMTALCVFGALQQDMAAEKDTWFSLTVSQVFTILLFSPAIIRVLTHPRIARPDAHRAAWFFGGLGGGYSFIVLYSLSGLPEWLAAATQTPMEQAVVTAFGQSPPAQQLFIALTAVIAAPMLEEIFFRGYLYRVLKRYTGVWPAMIGVSLFFGTVHMSLVQCLPLAMFGFILNMAYENTGRLSLPIAMHAAFNAVGVALIYAFPHMQHV